MALASFRTLRLAGPNGFDELGGVRRDGRLREARRASPASGFGLDVFVNGNLMMAMKPLGEDARKVVQDHKMAHYQNSATIYLYNRTEPPRVCRRAPTLEKVEP